jgi:predicted ATPase
MYIVSVEVENLLNRPGKLNAVFNRDLNILTGRNGAGKTSLLKLIWYVMSGNILPALQEVAFSRIRLVTSEYDVVVHRLNRVTCRVEYSDGEGRNWLFEDVFDGENDLIENAEDLANARLRKQGSSIFFPTFRRIEGGFTLSYSREPGLAPRGIFGQASRAGSEIEEGMGALSRRLTNEKHVFVASISTTDISSLLLSRFADLSQEYSLIQQSMSEDVIDTIKKLRSPANLDEGKTNLEAALDNIANKIQNVEDMREQIMAPFAAMKQLVEELFRHSGISFGKRLSIGDTANAVNSDALSAGEKQMLSFISYNAFNSQTPFLIDEPELSLHVDWQRQLFPILLRQQSSNQFVIATHSPFIYGKYPDKEIKIDLDRGDSE